MEYAAKEVGNFTIYVNAAIIGFIICFFTGNYSIVPFVVPLFVQIIARSNVKYRQRHISALVELPAQTEDPVFIMDIQGNILLSTGKTRDLFKKHSINNISGFIDRKALDAIIEMVFRDTLSPSIPSVETYSNISQKWYEIKAKTAGMSYGEKTQKVLVWFQDISLRKTYDLRLRDLLRYSDSLISSLKEFVKSGSIFEHLSLFLLKDYEAVFITRTDKNKNLVGYVFKICSGKIQRSESIIIPKESLAPINISRKESQIISDDMSNYNSKDDFLHKNPLDPKVLDFIDVPIQNFITYNEADISIIAFNFISTITTYEESFFEILVNIYRTMVMLVELEQDHEKNLK
ncbi:MAG: hypothetical protein KKE44_17555 [Proteobacteria bacterium]|nr:hypothetical protein [Pseudomonadota bacterium]MBU1584539.1 hypothetical protein [Pseudomonadota bacterium]